MIGNRQIVDGSVVDGSVAELCLVTDVDRTCYNTSKGAELLLGAAAQVLGADTSEVASSINCRRKQGLTTQIHDWLKDSGQPYFLCLLRPLWEQLDPFRWPTT